MNKIRRAPADLSLSIVVYAFLFVVFVITFYPFWNIFIISLNDATDTLRGSLFLFPRKLSFSSYSVVLRESAFARSLIVTVARTAIGTPLAIISTAMAAYALTHDKMPGRKILSLIYIFTMYFGGGLIPYYMVLKAVRLTDNFLVYIIPHMIDVFFLIITMSYMRSLPAEVEEAAKVEGAGYGGIFFRIIIPVCSPILATIGLFYAINHWNSWFDSYAFTYKESLKTLQAYLVQILNQYKGGDMSRVSSMLADSMKQTQISSESIRMATSMIATIPIILVYPFVQKYFVKGIMVGAVKA